MNLLNKLTLKNLKLNKKRTIVTIIGIILSVSLLTAVASLYESSVNSLINYEKAEKGNFHVAYYDVPIEELSIIRNNREIEDMYLTKDIGYAQINSKNDSKTYAFVKAFTKKSMDNLSVKLVSGRLPENDSEIVIPTHLKTNGRVVLNVGDTITLDIGTRISDDNIVLYQNNPMQDNEKIIDTEAKTYKIVGIIERPATNIESYTAPGYTFITYMDESDIGDKVDVYARYTKYGTKNVYKITANILGVDEKLFEKVSNGNASMDETLKYNKEERPKYDTNLNSYLIGLETNPIGSSEIVGLDVVVVIVILIIIFTSIFCIKNSFDISITEKIKQYGMLRSIGATKKQIKNNVFYEATILGIIGIPLGVICGFIASYILVIISNYYFEKITLGIISLSFSFSFVAVLVSVLLGVLTIYFSAFKSAKRASKVSPIDSIRNSANIKIKNKKIKSSKIIRKIFGVGGEISYKNVKRNKRKYRTITLSIIISVFVFIGISSFITMAYREIKEELDLTEYNLSLTTNNYTKENLNEFIETTKLDYIQDYSVVRYKEFKINNVKYNKEYLEWTNLGEDYNRETYCRIYTVGEEQFRKYIKSLGLEYENVKNKAILCNCYEYFIKSDENNKEVDSKKIKRLDYDVGDKINCIFEDENEYSLEIATITDEKPFGLKKYNSNIIIVSDELFDSITSTTGLEILYKSTNASQLQDDIENYLSDEIFSLNNSEERVRMMENLLILVQIFLYGFIIVVSLIGVTNIFNTITTNMELRSQEFAILKSVGMTNKEFNRMIKLESIFIGFKALFIGIPLGIAPSYLMYMYFNEAEYDIPFLSIIISICAVFILITLIMKYSLNKINKQNTIDTIRNENI